MHKKTSSFAQALEIEAMKMRIDDASRSPSPMEEITLSLEEKLKDKDDIIASLQLTIKKLTSENEELQQEKIEYGKLGTHISSNFVLVINIVLFTTNYKIPLAIILLVFSL